MSMFEEPVREKIWCLCSYVNEDKDSCSEIINDYHYEIKTVSYGGKYWSIGAPYATLEGCIEGEKIPEQPCRKCGQIYGNRYSHKDLSILGLCFSCDLWTERVQSKRKIVIEHVMYSDGGRKSRDEAGFLGHGGREFKIEMNDSTIIKTNNLWCGGDVPKRFQDEIPDNAKFIN